LKDNHPTNWIRSIEWTTKNITHLEKVNNKFTWTVNFSLDNMIAGFITEFGVYTVKSYSVAKQDALKGQIGRYIISVYMLIKILLHDKGMMTMESNNEITPHTWEN
jgi:hypothetical protein